MKQTTIIGLAALLLAGSALAVNPTNMVFVEGGAFTMGDTWGDGAANEKPVRQVTLDSFEISQYEISKQEMARVMNWAIEEELIEVDDGRVVSLDRGAEKELFSGGLLQWDEEDTLFLSSDGWPVKVGWYAAAAYCNYRSKMEGLSPCYKMKGRGRWKCDFRKNGYRLPTEAEWEFSARGGVERSQTRYSGSDTLTEVAWFYDNTRETKTFMGRVRVPGTPGFDFSRFGGPSQKGTPDTYETITEQRQVNTLRVIGSKKANVLGLYDMSGNAAEWCSDWYAEYSSGSQINPVCLQMPNKADDSCCVVRGGSCASRAEACRVSARSKGHPEKDRAGFRVVRSVLSQKSAD